MVNNSAFSVIFDMTSHCSNYNHYRSKDVKLSLFKHRALEKINYSIKTDPPPSLYSVG